MATVFEVWHTYTEGGEDDEEINAKCLRVFSTRARAEERIALARTEDGFRDWPDGFLIDECRVDEPQWVGGFVRV
jgi:hypothetical protein